MAKKPTTVVVCDRDGFGKQRPATQRRRACIEGTWYEWALCEEHAEKWDRDMFGWSRLGTETVPPLRSAHANRPATQTLDSDYVERARRAAQLRAEQTARPLAAVPHHHDETDEPAVSEPAPGERWSNGWLLTPHADDRAEERGYTLDEVMAAATSPQISYADPARPGVWIHQRGECAVAVDRGDKVVITVLHRDEAKYALDHCSTSTNGRIAQ